MLQPNAPLAHRGQVTRAPRFWLVLLLTGVGAGLGWWLLCGPVSRWLDRSSGASESVRAPTGRLGFGRTVLDGALQIVIVGGLARP